MASIAKHEPSWKRGTMISQRESKQGQQMSTTKALTIREGTNGDGPLSLIALSFFSAESLEITIANSKLQMMISFIKLFIMTYYGLVWD